jgi:hypothetical protein
VVFSSREGGDIGAGHHRLLKSLWAAVDEVECAPHHPHLKAFPQHKHLAEEATPVDSHERSLVDVLAFIAKRLK